MSNVVSWSLEILIKMASLKLVAAGYKSGLWLLEPQADGTYSPTLIDADSNGYEHSSYGAESQW